MLKFGLAILLVGASHAQQLELEVASIKPTAKEQFKDASSYEWAYGRLTISNRTVRGCISWAWGLGPNEIQGGPDWVRADRYEIVAKADQPKDDRESMMVLMQQVLVERFQLRFHWENRLTETLVLEVGKSGPKIERVEDQTNREIHTGRGRIEAKAYIMQRLAEVLSGQSDLPVVDGTKLEGAYNFSLRWSPDASEDGPSLFTAVQEQLGLRLTAKKTAVRVFVIDHLERPSDN